MRTIKSITRTADISIDKNRSVSEAIEVMCKNNEGTVIVLDQDKIVGILTERDIVALLDKHEDLEQPVIHISKKNIISININRSIEYALHILIDNNIRRLVILSDDGSFAGIVTQEMLINKFEEKHYRVDLNVSQLLSNTTTNIITLPIQATLEDAVSQMHDHKIGSILISDTTQIVGIITERDLIRCVRKSIPMNSPIEKVMSSPVISVSMNDTVHDIVTMMQERHIRRVLVSDEENNPLGIVGIRDIVKSIKGNYGLFIENKLKYTKLTFNTINELVLELYVDKEATLIQWGNHAALETYGQKIIDKPIETLISADVWAEILHILSTEEKIIDYKIQIGEKWYLVSCNHHNKDTFGQSFLLVCKDITIYENHFAYEKEIWLKRERIELALRGSNDGIWDWNILKNTNYFSPRWKEMLGYADNELSNEHSTWEDRIHPDDREAVMSNIQHNMQGKSKYFENIYRLKHKDGSWVWVLDRGKTLFDADNKAIRMIGTHTDITEEKKKQLELAHKAQVIEQIHDAVTITDLNGYIINCNPAAERLTGYKEDEIIGKHMKTFYLENEYYRIRKDFTKLLQKGLYQTKVQVINKAKELIDIELSLSLLKDASGNPIGGVGYARDITKQKRAEDKIKYLNDTLQKEVARQLEQIREKDKQLLQQSRMAQMGEMLSMIAHQWRQPLAAISATSASLELKASMGKLDNDTAQQKARDISDFSQHLSRTIDDFRDFFKPNKQKEETSYDELIKSVLKIISTSITNKNIKLIQELNTHDKFISYPNELKQVILNLIKNAEDILIKKQIKNPTIKISTYTKNNTNILEISDNAGGVEEDNIDKIFNPYFSTKKQKDGTGLGLYMSKMIIEEHCSGKLSVTNGEDGAVFKIVLYKIPDEKEAWHD